MAQMPILFCRKIQFQIYFFQLNILDNVIIKLQKENF